MHLIVPAKSCCQICFPQLTRRTQTTAGATDNREQFEFATEIPDSWTEQQPQWERLRGPNQVRHVPGFWGQPELITATSGPPRVRI